MLLSNAKLNKAPMSVLGMDSAGEMIDRLVDPDADQNVTLH
jgi:hypothetical protein